MTEVDHRALAEAPASGEPHQDPLRRSDLLRFGYSPGWNRDVLAGPTKNSACHAAHPGNAYVLFLPNGSAAALVMDEEKSLELTWIDIDSGSIASQRDLAIAPACTWLHRQRGLGSRSSLVPRQSVVAHSQGLDSCAGARIELVSYRRP